MNAVSSFQPNSVNPSTLNRHSSFIYFPPPWAPLLLRARNFLRLVGVLRVAASPADWSQKISAVTITSEGLSSCFLSEWQQFA